MIWAVLLGYVAGFYTAYRIAWRFIYRPRPI